MPRFISLLIFIALSLGYSWSSRAQASFSAPDLQFRQINEGLSANHIFDIVQDHQGYTWVATYAGINRYDGHTFKYYKQGDPAKGGLRTNDVNNIVVDPQGRVWAAIDNGGVARYDREKDLFVSYYPKEGSNTGLAHNDVSYVYVGKKGQVLAATADGLHRWNPVKDEFERLQALNSLLKNPVISRVHEDTDGFLWIGTTTDLTRYNPEANQIDYIPMVNGSSGKPVEAIIQEIVQSSQGDVWVGTQEQGIFRFQEVEAGKWEQVKHYVHNPNDDSTLGNNAVRAIVEDQEGNLWVGAENGKLNLYNPSNDGFYKYGMDPQNPLALQDNSIWAIYPTSNGRLFLGTFNQGIQIHDPYFRKFSHIKVDNSCLPNNVVTCFGETEDGYLWIGTDGGGVVRKNTQTGECKVYQYDLKDKHSLGSNAVLDVYIDSQGDIWVSTWEGGLNRYRPKTDDFKRYLPSTPMASPITQPYVFEVGEDSKGRLWIANFRCGLAMYNREEDSFTNFCFEGDQGPASGRVPSFIALALHVDREDRVWLGTSEGVALVQEQEDGTFSIRNYQPDPNSTDSLVNRVVNSIYESKDGSIWIVTGEGLSLYQPETDSFLSWNEELPESACVGMIEDEQGRYWVTTQSGLFTMVKNKEGKGYQYKSYNLYDGLQSEEFRRHAVYQDTAGVIYLGGVNGYNHFTVDQVKPNPVAPTIYLKDLRIFNKSAGIDSADSPLTKQLSEMKSISLNHTQSVFSIEYIGISYTHPKENKYAYRLLGLEEEWNYVGKRTFASYSNLDAGTYTFEVKGANHDGIWSKTPTKLNIIIIPPWWEANWFRVSVLLLLIIGGYSAYHIRVQMLESQKERLEVLVSERTRSLQEKQQEIETQNEELTQQSEEIMAQRDALEKSQAEVEERNAVLKRQSEEITKQHSKLEEAYIDAQSKNEIITDSIRYAQTIQSSILPSASRLSEIYQEHFEVYLPKDIVSGDFYWGTEREGVRFISVIDCTGHGVPGAFMSMIGNTLLNRIVKELHIFDTAAILEKLNEGVISSLRQRSSENSDGMDLALCAIRDIGNDEFTIEFCGAKNSLFYHSKAQPDTIHRLRGNRKSIGGQRNAGVSFSSHTITLKKGDSIYLCSDGLIDMQTPDGRKVGALGFRKMTLEMIEEPLSKHQEVWYEKIAEYSKTHEQRDDITVVGVRL